MVSPPPQRCRGMTVLKKNKLVFFLPFVVSLLLDYIHSQLFGQIMINNAGFIFAGLFQVPGHRSFFLLYNPLVLVYYMAPPPSKKKIIFNSLEHTHAPATI